VEVFVLGMCPKLNSYFGKEITDSTKQQKLKNMRWEEKYRPMLLHSFIIVYFG